MLLDFQDEKLKQLYEGEKISNKNYRFPKPLIKQYIKTIEWLLNTQRIEQLAQIKALRYEKLKGNLKGKSSVSINMQYRLIFEEITDDADPPKIVLLRIEEISKHYE